MNKISFQYVPKHLSSLGKEGSIMIPDQTRIIIDGNDYFDDCYGMYPEDFFSQNKHFFRGELQVGICGCSAYGCADEFMEENII